MWCHQLTSPALDGHTVAGRRAEQQRAVSYGSSGDFRPGPVSSSTGGMRQLKRALAPAAPQTEPCWLSAEATWRHGERPADSWGGLGAGGAERCHGNQGSNPLMLSQDSRAAPSGAKQVCKRRKREYLHAQRNLSQHKLQLNKRFLKGQTVSMMDDYSNLNQASSDRDWKYADMPDMQRQIWSSLLYGLLLTSNQSVFVSPRWTELHDGFTNQTHCNYETAKNDCINSQIKPGRGMVMCCLDVLSDTKVKEFFFLQNIASSWSWVEDVCTCSIRQQFFGQDQNN